MDIMGPAEGSNGIKANGEKAQDGKVNFRYHVIVGWLFLKIVC